MEQMFKDQQLLVGIDKQKAVTIVDNAPAKAEK
jgi:hypothetical protein